jgi:Mn2+/Fe2+ NRAMP family transporter
LILPVALTIMLIAVAKKKLFTGYQHPAWLQIVGWVVVVVMSCMGGIVIAESLEKLG